MEEKTTLLIIAAGNGSRMGYLPKAVSLVKGKPNLYNTVEKAYDYFDQIFVFTLDKYKKLFEEVIESFSDKCKVFDIISGYGCGDAVRTSLKIVEKQVATNVVMMWGDVYITNEKIFQEILNKIMDTPLLIPTVFEEDPYVWFPQDRKFMAFSAMFKKRNETINNGYHDQSIFRFNKKKIIDALDMMYNVNRKMNSYIHDELVFLDVVHLLYNLGIPARIYETEFETMGYNTHGELLDINKKILEKKIK